MKTKTEVIDALTSYFADFKHPSLDGKLEFNADFGGDNQDTWRIVARIPLIGYPERLAVRWFLLDELIEHSIEGVGQLLNVGILDYCNNPPPYEKLEIAFGSYDEDETAK
jgi:hypothetical protein